MANESEFGNFSYSFFGPMEMMFSEEVIVIDEPLAVKIIISFLLTVIMIASVIGNVLTCCVIARYRSMRTPTNCYLFSLAVTDFLISLFIPFEIYILWVPDFYPFGEPGCLLHLVLLNALSNLSVLTISAFTVERYVVVHKPFLYKKMSNTSRVFKIVAFIWIISWAFSVPESFTTDILVMKNYVLCYTTISYEIRILIAFQVVFFFMVPMAKITILYIMIALKLRSAGNHMENLPANLKHYREKVVKMLGKLQIPYIRFSYYELNKTVYIRMLGKVAKVLFSIQIDFNKMSCQVFSILRAKNTKPIFPF